MYCAPKKIHSCPSCPARRPLLVQLWDKCRLHCLALFLRIGTATAPHPHLALQHLQAKVAVSAGFLQLLPPSADVYIAACSACMKTPAFYFQVRYSQNRNNKLHARWQLEGQQ